MTQLNVTCAIVLHTSNQLNNLKVLRPNCDALGLQLARIHVVHDAMHCQGGCIPRLVICTCYCVSATTLHSPLPLS